jgi:hypothetical protein
MLLTGGRCSEAHICYKDSNYDFKMVVLDAGGRFSEVVISSGLIVSDFCNISTHSSTWLRHSQYERTLLSKIRF